MYPRIKRAFDIVVAGAALIGFLPLFLIIGLLIRLDSAGPVFFRQFRAGKDGVPFLIYKFRTMYTSPQPQRGFLPADDPRITRVGRWLRRLSLDELPQLINVLRGEMSLIGPRPALLHHVKRYNPRQRRRLEVRPGITGWAQVNGRNSLTWEEKLEFDVEYVERCSLWMDLYILFKTFKVVFKQSDLYFQGKGNAWSAPVPKVKTK
jgi:lipopolysaccharide/colanic/teichoic acid biosynthesis glycosyltransferase